MPYYLDNAFLLDNPWITVVGCVGTGGFVAEGLCRLFQGRKATIVLVDHDRVGAPQPAAPEHSTQRTWGASRARPSPTGWPGPTGGPSATRFYAFREEDSGSDGGRYPGLPAYGNSLLIGCADNAAARRAMAECLPGDPRQWLIDAGNDTNWGQVLIGNVADRDFGDEAAFVDQTCYLLPAPTVQPDRPADGGVDQAAGRRLRGRPRPHRPGPHHQPDDGVAGATGGPPHGGGLLPLHGPLPGHGAGNGQSELRHPGGGGATGEVGLLAAPVIDAHEHIQRSNKEKEKTDA